MINLVIVLQFLARLFLLIIGFYLGHKFNFVTKAKALRKFCLKKILFYLRSKSFIFLFEILDFYLWWVAYTISLQLKRDNRI